MHRITAPACCTTPRPSGEGAPRSRAFDRRTLLLGGAAAAALAALPASGVIPSAAAEYVASAGDSRYTVSHYAIAETISPSATTATRISGTTTMTAHATTSTSSLKVDFAMRPAGAEISTDAGRTWSTCSLSNVNPAAGYRRFTVGGFSLSQGQNFQLRIRYNDTPRSFSGEALNKYSPQYFVVAGEPFAAGHWFPCNDRLTDKSTYSITITTRATNKVLLTNPLSRTYRTVNGTRMMTVEFAVTQPSTPYQLGVAVGPFTTTQGTWTIGGRTIPFHNATAGGSLATIAAHTPRALNYFAARYGNFPFDHAGGVLAPDMPVGAQETIGAPTYDSGTNKLAFVAHENAHMWFGNSVTATTWQDALLFQEGLATLLEDDYVKAMAPGAYQWAIPSTNPARVTTLPTDFTVTAAVYSQASGLMRQVRLAMDGTASEPNAPRFRSLLNAIATEHRYGYLTRSDFKTLANKHAGRDLRTTWDTYGF